MNRCVGLLSLLLLIVACAPVRVQKGRLVPLKIEVQFEAAEKAGSSFSGTLNATTLETSAPIVTPTATSTVATSTLAETLNRILVQPETLVSTGAEAFKNKRVFRWLSFKVSRGTEVLKSGSTEILDPQTFEVAPIEFDAAIGDNVSVAISLFQVDYMTARDADAFCQLGAPGLVRTWAGTSSQTVDDQGVMTVSLTSAGQSTVHMAAVGSADPFITSLKAADLRHVIFDFATGQQFEGQLCKVFDLPAIETTPGLRFMKMMTLSQPLKSHALGLRSLNSKGILLPKGSTAAWSTATDMRAAADLGVTLAARAAVNTDGSWEINRVLPTDLLGYSWLPIRPQITIGQPSLNVVNSTSRAEFQISVPSGARLNLDNSKIFLNGSGPACNASVVRNEAQGTAAVVLESCTGDGAVYFSLAEGSAISEAGTRSATVDSSPLVVDNTAPNLFVISPPTNSYVGQYFTLDGFCEIGGSKVYLSDANGTSLQSDCLANSDGYPHYQFTISSNGQSGERQFILKQSDALGNTRTVPFTVIHDLMPPILNVSSSVTSIGATGSILYTISATDSPPASSGVSTINLSNIGLNTSSTVTSCSKAIDTANNNLSVSGCQGFGSVSLNIPDGVAVDAVGNSSAAISSVGSVIVDTVGPILEVTYPTSANWVNGTFTLSGKCEFGGSNVTVTAATTGSLSVTDASVGCSTTGTFTTNVTPHSVVSGGSGNSLVITQSDALGNSSSLTHSIQFDNVLPTLSVTPFGVIFTNATNSKEFTFSASDSGGSGVDTVNLAGIDFTLSSGSVADCVVVRTAPKITISGCTGDGVMSMIVPAGVVLDKAGNSSVNYSNIVALNVDNTPPVVTLGSLGTTNVNSANVSITLSGTCSVGDGNVFLDGDVVSQQTSCSSGGTGSTGVFYLSSFQLTDGYGAKNIRIKQIDAAGNVGTSATQTITRLPAPPTITTTLPLQGLRPEFSGTCDSSVGNTTTVSTTSGRVIAVNCVSGQLKGMLSFSFGSGTSGTITVTTTAPGGYASSTSFPFSRNTPSCPMGFVPVSGLTTAENGLGNAHSTSGNLRAWLDIGQDFCVMKFQAKQSTSTTGAINLSGYSALPWTNISRNDAMNKCATLCSSGAGCTVQSNTIPGSTEIIYSNEMRGYRLISNMQWQIVARRILSKNANWTSGLAGSGQLYQGHTDAAPAAPLMNYSSDYPEPTQIAAAYYGTNDNFDVNATQRRVHVLDDATDYSTSTNYIVDFSGNVWQWVSDDLSVANSTGLGVGLSTSFSSGWSAFPTFTNGNLGQIFGSGGTYSSSNLIGEFHAPTTIPANPGIVRGGFHGDVNSSLVNFGIFASDVGRDSTSAYPNVGFRCVFVP